MTTRRSFLKSGLTGAAASTLIIAGSMAQIVIPDSVAEKNRNFVGDKGPQLEPALVQEFVRLSHFDFDSVRKMIKESPALALASWDWGGGDFETGLGAASHVGNREIALFLLEHDARPNLFSAAMLGQLDIVKGFLTADASLIDCKGPHGLSLMHHAVKGGKMAEAVVAYLEKI